MREPTIRETFQDIVRDISAKWSDDRARAARETRVPKSLRPHAARTTFRPMTDVEVSRRVAA